jgi:hypothetical protein
MASGRLWGLLGVVLALVGLVVIAPELLAAVGEGLHGTEGLLLGLYGAGVVLAVVVTILIIGPNVVRPS